MTERSRQSDNSMHLGKALGFLQVRSMDEAIELVRRCPVPLPGEETEPELAAGSDPRTSAVTPKLHTRPLTGRTPMTIHSNKAPTR